MKPSHYLALIPALGVAMCFAQPAQFAPRMTGQQLVDQFRGPAEEGANLSARSTTYRQHAKGYLDGINDATEGRLWCYTGRWKETERDSAIIFELAALPPETLKGNAAPLVLNFLRKKYPCQAAHADRKGG